jgi:hypothetical protein
LLAFGYDGDVTHTKLEQPFASAGIVQHIDRFEVDTFTRKKLFRP